MQIINKTKAPLPSYILLKLSSAIDVAIIRNINIDDNITSCIKPHMNSQDQHKGIVTEAEGVLGTNSIWSQQSWS